MQEEYKESGDNFFLWASFLDPHPPYFVLEPWDTMYDPDDITVSGLTESEQRENPPHFKLIQEKSLDFLSISRIWFWCS